MFLRFLFEYFTSRPLHMSTFRNTLDYAMVAFLLNNSINSFWVTKDNPEGLTGFWGNLVTIMSFGLCLWLCRKENHWVNEIRAREKGL